MEYKTLELRVGFTIFIAVLVFTVGLMWFEGFEIGRKTYQLHAIFPMVGGIDPGDAVHVNGVEKGEVKGVELRDDDVIITMSVDVEARIPDDSRVVLQTRGIMGERIVSIILGSSLHHVESGAILKGVYDPGISEALASMGNVFEALSELASDVRDLTDALGEGDKLKRTIDNLEAVTGELKAGIEGRSGSISEGIVSFGRAASRIDSVVSRNAPRIDSVLTKFDRTGDGLQVLVDRLAEVTEDLGEITERLKSDDSTLGALMKDRELLTRLETTVTDLDELIKDIRANPKKYLKLEIF